jgi:hypothetical protein
MGALPNLVIIGAMKCGTTALHQALALHPDIAMSEPKELNFFFGPEAGDGSWEAGNWHRGLEWYCGHWPAPAPVRGESSPGYTSPSHPEVAARMAAVLPDARLVYLVRDPIARAVSQYRHHGRDGTETRPIEQALMDPASQYLSRSRYVERLDPFLRCFPHEGVAVVAMESLAGDRRRTIRRLFGFAGADDGYWSDDLDAGVSAETPLPAVPAALAEGLREALRDDAERLRAIAGEEFPGWSV